MPRLPLLLGTLATLIVLACGAAIDRNAALAAASVTAAAQNKIAVADYAFKPARLTVAAGTKVTWTNSDDDPHTITSTQPLFDSNGLGQGESYSYVFRKAGTYEYYCKAHPFMKGVIIVEAAKS